MCHLSQDSRTFCTKLRGVKPFLAFASLVALPSLLWSAEIIEGEMAGCLFAPAEKVQEELNGGFSLYAAAWPLVGTYPGHRFQTGLCGTWMHLQWSDADQPKEKCYTDIKGGLGGWRDTHFPTITPKFIMGGVGPNFSVIANGPGYGAGTWEKPRGQYGVAQLSPWLLMPLDGLNLKQGTSGELFGYGSLPLPLTNKKHHCRQKRADRQPVLDAVFERRQLQRPRGFFHTVFLVAGAHRASRVDRQTARPLHRGP
jgi:hypothetical protein